MAWLSKVTFLGEEELNNSGCQSHGGGMGQAVVVLGCRAVKTPTLCLPAWEGQGPSGPWVRAEHTQLGRLPASSGTWANWPSQCSMDWGPSGPELKSALAW